MSANSEGMNRMLADINSEVRYTSRMIGRDKLDERVMNAMAEVPRDAFVPEHMKDLAFENGPLPIGHGQTISQPYIVALMTDLLAPQPGQKILEIGTGSGYQTAVLSRLCNKVYSMDVIPALTEAAAVLLKELGYDNIEIRCGNGYQGWPEHGPYDGIIVTAAADYIPQQLVEQLKPDSRMVIPVGPSHGPQELRLLTRDHEGNTSIKDILGVAFVPMVDRNPGQE